MMGLYEAVREMYDIFPNWPPFQMPPEPVSAIHQYMFELGVTRLMSDSRNTPSVPIGVIGGPLLQRDRVLFEVIRDCGGQITFDGTETGDRAWCHFNLCHVHENPLRELMEVYFRIPDPSRRPNSEFYRWLKDRVEGTGARGLVLHHYVWCDKWHAEFARMKEWIKLPMLRLDSEGDGELDSPRVRNRIAAFVETLR